MFKTICPFYIFPFFLFPQFQLSFFLYSIPDFPLHSPCLPFSIFFLFLASFSYFLAPSYLSPFFLISHEPSFSFLPFFFFLSKVIFFPIILTFPCLLANGNFIHSWSRTIVESILPGSILQDVSTLPAYLTTRNYCKT